MSEMDAKPVIAVFDVGKTNKKVFLFNEQYQIVFEKTDKFSETIDEDGDPCEDLSKLTSWLLDSFELLLNKSEYRICAVNFCAYGASLVHLDEQGKPFLPLYNYLKTFPQGLSERFISEHGQEKDISRETASPVMGHLNSGMQLYRLTQEKQLSKKPGYSLHLPQYLSYLITGQCYSDITSLGCHTMLWNYSKHAYHKWVTEEGIDRRLAPLFPSDGVVITRRNGEEIVAGAGLHDSSAALIPYLSGFQQPFILISTGSWCISMNPFNDTPLTESELEEDCLCYMTYKGHPVKASRLFAGYEHELQVQRLAAHFNKPADYFSKVSFDKSYLETAPGNPALPNPEGKAELTIREYLENDRMSMFKHRSLERFSSYEEAYHWLINDIIQLQVLSTQLVMKGSAVSRIFVDGGFGKNQVYMHLLANAFPALEVYAASVAQATAMGAALAVHAHWNQLPLPTDLIDLKYYSGDLRSV